MAMNADFQNPTAQSPETPAHLPRWWQASKASLLIGGVVLCFDVVLDGSYGFSVLVCPIWFLVSVVKNLIWRPGRGVALFRIAMPLLVLGAAITNDSIQWSIAETNAAQVIKACEEFHVANGRYPKTLDELVPGYLPSVPWAKYCLNPMSRFLYFNYSANDSLLVWQRMGWYRKTYRFGANRYGYLD